MVGKCCRYALLNATQESRAINCSVSPLYPLPASCLKQPRAWVMHSPSHRTEWIRFTDWAHMFAERDTSTPVMRKRNETWLPNITEITPLKLTGWIHPCFKMMLRFIRVDNENTRAERAQTDKAAPMRDIRVMLNRNLERAYKPHECITIDEQFYPFGGHTKFTRHIPSKLAK